MLCYDLHVTAILKSVFPPSRINLTAFRMELQHMHFDIGFEMKWVNKIIIQYYFHGTLERNFCNKFKYF